MTNNSNKSLREKHNQFIKERNDRKIQSENDKKIKARNELINNYKNNINKYIVNFEQELSNSAKNGKDLKVPILKFECKEVTSSFYTWMRENPSIPEEEKSVEITCQHIEKYLPVEISESELKETLDSPKYLNLKIVDPKVQSLYDLIISHDFVPKWYSSYSELDRSHYNTSTFDPDDCIQGVHSYSSTNSIYILDLIADSNESYKIFIAKKEQKIKKNKEREQQRKHELKLKEKAKQKENSILILISLIVNVALVGFFWYEFGFWPMVIIMIIIIIIYRGSDLI